MGAAGTLRPCPPTSWSCGLRWRPNASRRVLRTRTCDAAPQSRNRMLPSQITSAESPPTRGVLRTSALLSHRIHVNPKSNTLMLTTTCILGLSAARRRQAPVFRALYSEKRVVAEERRARIDNAPLGRFQEAFAGAALGNNYRRPVIGYAQDVEALVRESCVLPQWWTLWLGHQ